MAWQKDFANFEFFFAAVAETTRDANASVISTESAVSHFGFDTDLTDQPSLHDLYTVEFFSWVQTSGLDTTWHHLVFCGEGFSLAVSFL